MQQWKSGERLTYYPEVQELCDDHGVTVAMNVNKEFGEFAAAASQSKSEMTLEQDDAILVKDRDERHPSAWWSMTIDFSRYGPDSEISRSFCIHWWIGITLTPAAKSSSDISLADAMQKLMAQIAEVPSAF